MSSITPRLPTSFLKPLPNGPFISTFAPISARLVIFKFLPEKNRNAAECIASPRRPASAARPKTKDMINPAIFDPWPVLRQYIAKPAKAPAAEIDEEAIIDAALLAANLLGAGLPVPTAPQPREPTAPG